MIKEPKLDQKNEGRELMNDEKLGCSMDHSEERNDDSGGSLNSSLEG